MTTPYVDMPTAEEVAEIERAGAKDRSARALAQLFVGLLLLGIGLWVTLGTGGYLIAKGAIGGGAILVGVGLFHLVSERRYLRQRRSAGT